jgi:hypothetical protein
VVKTFLSNIFERVSHYIRPTDIKNLNRINHDINLFTFCLNDIVLSPAFMFSEALVDHT